MTGDRYLLAVAVVLAVALVVVTILGRRDRRDADRLTRVTVRQRVQLRHRRAREHSLRAELTLLTEAYDALVAERRRAVATAALDVTAELPLPPLDARTLRQVQAATPADFDTPGETP